MHCPSWRFPGVDGWHGGYAELMRTSARSLVKLPAGLDPAAVAPHADAGLTAIHAVKRVAPFLAPGTNVVVIGAAGGVGHLAVQLLRRLTPARVIAVERGEEQAAFARSFGADAAHVGGADGGIGVVLADTDGGAHVVLDLVGEHDVPAQALKMLRKGGVYSIVGYGGRVELEHLDMINRELTVLGNQIGSHTDLAELMQLVHEGKLELGSERFPLDGVADALREVAAGRVQGRAVLVPA
jgi:D-arabinose 1-dehydrogenase-like Zn-dependent alcohol dehydrogenase